MNEYTIRLYVTEEQQERLERGCSLLGDETPESLFAFIMRVGSCAWIDHQLDIMERQEPLKTLLCEAELQF